MARSDESTSTLTSATPDSATSPRAAGSPLTIEQRLVRVAVDLDAAAANWRFFDRLSPNAEAAAVVKADAYGLGAHALAPAFARAGARTFFVAAAAEAAALRAILGPGPAIYLLGGFHAADAALLSSCEVRPVLNSAAEAASWLTAGRPGGGCAVHLDTGMNRLGASASDDPA
ncbi:MAG: alanine racemase, partial [Alphaproteobacteria bacterium]|nr:alanine racemase [Alphaproteobacteria bacterium]